MEDDDLRRWLAMALAPIMAIATFSPHCLPAAARRWTLSVWVRIKTLVINKISRLILYKINSYLDYK